MTTATTASPSRPRGRLAAVWFADIVGYTSLAAENHARALAVVELFQALAAGEVESSGGRIVKFIGDAALAEFPSTSAALQAAGSLQTTFAARSLDLGAEAQLRIGVHLGEIEAATDGDIYGDGVNTASRLQGEAEPGHVLVSEDVWRSLRSHPEFDFAPAGRRRLRGTAAPMAVFEAVPKAATADRGEHRRARRGLEWAWGWRLVAVLGAYGVVAALVLAGIERLVLQGTLPQVAHEIARIWIGAGVPLLLLIGWFHGYRRHRRVRRSERLLGGAFALVLIVATGLAVAEHVQRERARALATAGGLDPRHIAVLHFDALGGDTADSYLAAGFTEELIDELSGVRVLEVVSPHGVAPFRESQLPPDSIARRLGAGTIVDGSIERLDDQLRLNVRLIDGVSGADIERAAFMLPADELLRVRDELVERVAGLLRGWLGEEVLLRDRRSGTESVAAWTLVQRASAARSDGMEALRHGDGHTAMALLMSADSMLAQAAAIDEDWGEPLVLRGRIAYDISREMHDPHEAAEWNARAREHGVAALIRNPNDAAAVELRGTSDYWRYVLNVEPDQETHEQLLVDARTDLEEAVRLDPTRATAHSTLSHLYYNYDLASAVLSAQRAYEEDAYLAVADAVLWRLFNGSLDLGQFRQAERWCREGHERFPGHYQFTLCRLMLMVTPALRPAVDEAWQLAEGVDSLADEEYPALMSRLSVGGVLARAGMVDSARSVLLRARRETTPSSDPQQELLAYEAYMRTLTGEEEEAMRLLRRYAAANPGHMEASHGSDTAWWWRSLKDRAWFQELTDH